MALNYPRLDNASGVWTLKEVTDAVKGGYWPNAGARGLFGGGYSPDGSTFTRNIDYVTISSTGDAADFGDLTLDIVNHAGAASFTRGCFAGGNIPASPYFSDMIDYVTIVTTGNAADFGDLIKGAHGGASTCSNSVRAINAGGTPATNEIDYWNMASLGNSSDFGDLTLARWYLNATASPKRALFSGGSSPTIVNTMDYITIASTGNAADFGDLTVALSANMDSGAASSTRGIHAGGDKDGSNFVSNIERVEMESTGNAIDYGDLSAAKYYLAGTDNSVRAIFAGGATPTFLNVMEYMNIPVGGTVVDFGDLTAPTRQTGGLSNCHGGLNDGNQGVVDTT